MTFYTYIRSPVGRLLLAADDEGLRLIEFEHPRHPYRLGDDWREGEHPLLDLARTQLDEYFNQGRRRFELKLAPRGTEFQRRVWSALATIGYGETLSYAGLAARIDAPRAVRAVGAANGRNPLPIVLPCHRVIGTDGSLTGFGGGLPVKRYLLELEGVPLERDLFGTASL
ncbi:methylated-DNA--[protein]-cysteine S-methyltransferase [Halotalea alkalilenta]|uniref:Methylated-DNA--protein-cysteine methyltransferase n=1 Tax=Halotalea alkalilenta TaxID=376489 RepID=A0A172YAN5_9GAMM|nr:methylated-DNA--[protein]-cysteine S-methyltransferase [Halotalea alkalilenta]ANF56311.1 cysteine methyltransferase [Halotalea alkalilenta]